MNEHIQLFLTYMLDERRVSVATIEAYTHDLQAFAHAMEEQLVRDVSEVTSKHVTDYFQQLQRTKAASSQARALVSLRSFFRYLLKERQVTYDPILHMKPPKREQKPPNILSPEEVERLLATPSGDDPFTLRDRAMLELLYATGVKVTELIAMDVDSLAPGVGFVKVRGIRHQERIVPLAEAAEQVVAQYLSCVGGT